VIQNIWSKYNDILNMSRMTDPQSQYTPTQLDSVNDHLKPILGTAEWAIHDFWLLFVNFKVLNIGVLVNVCGHDLWGWCWWIFGFVHLSTLKIINYY